MYDNVVVYLQPTKFKNYLLDPRLSLQAKGLMGVICEAYAMEFTNPFSKSFNIAEIARKCRESWQTVNRSFDELLTLGYAKKTKKTEGRLTMNIYTISEGGGLNDKLDRRIRSDTSC